MTRGHRRNWDWLSISAFTAAGVFGAVSAANNVRNSFWHNFIHGFNEIDTLFKPLKEKFTAKFQETAGALKKGEIDGVTYRKTMRTTAKEYRKEIADKLLKDFDIPTNGIRGWTEGTYKRVQELGLASRIHNTLGFATVAAVSVGAIAVLRHSKHTLDRVENEIDQQRAR